MKDYFYNYRAVPEKLVNFGFIKNNGTLIYETNIMNGDLVVTITFYNDNKIDFKVVDTNTKDDYALIFVDNAIGNYVGKAKQEFEKIIENIKENCFEKDVFKSSQARQVIKYVKEKYNDDLEYLWSKFPKNAVWRHKENNKWYGIIMNISKVKLGLDDDCETDIIVLKYPKDDIENVIDNKRIFAGYHMNKKSWITIPLDATMKTEDIYKYIDISYGLK